MTYLSFLVPNRWAPLIRICRLTQPQIIQKETMNLLFQYSDVCVQLKVQATGRCSLIEMIVRLVWPVELKEINKLT